MGAIYDPKDADNLIQAMNSNISTGEQIVEKLLTASQYLISTLGSNQLSGKAYDAGKGLFEDVIIPIINKAKEALEDVKEDLSRFETQINDVKNSPYGRHILDEDVLKKQLDQYKTQQTVTNQMIHNLTAISPSTVGGNNITEMYSGMESEYRGLLNIFEDDIHKTEDKLKLLSQVDSGTSSLFTKASDALKTISSAMYILRDTKINLESGSYTLPKGVDGSWFSHMKEPYKAKKSDRKNKKDVENYDIITTYTTTYVDPSSKVQHGMTVVYNETTGEILDEEGWGAGGELQASLAKYGPGMVTDVRREYAKTSYNEDMVKLQASQSKSTRVGNSIATFATSIARAKGITDSLKNITETVSGKDYNKRVKEAEAEKEKAEREREKEQRIKDLQAISSGGPAYFGN
jgi:hypothetical protein